MGENPKFFDVCAPATSEKLCSVLAGDEAITNTAIEVAQTTFESGEMR